MTDTTTGYPDPYAPHAPAPHPYVASQPPVADSGDNDTPDGSEAVVDAPEKIDLVELSGSVNGFDQIAIRSRFHERFDTLAEDPTMFSRALYFVHLRRQGVKDADAFQQAMLIPFGEISDLFETPGDDTDLDEDESATQERDRQYAEFVMGTGLKYTMDEYLALTIQQRGAIVEAANNR